VTSTSTRRAWRVLLGLAIVAAIMALSPGSAYADDDLLTGRWAVTDANGQKMIIEIRPAGGHRYRGRVDEKAANNSYCWPLNVDVITVSGSGRHFTGTAWLYNKDSGCRDRVEDGTIVIDIDRSGKAAQVTISSGSTVPCTDCPPETWSRASPPPPPAFPMWLIPTALAALAVPVGLILMRPSARARRRDKRRARSPAHVRLHPRPGLPAAPTVQVPPVPALHIRIEPRLELGEPFVQEAPR
jgi:hypothetical protein